MAVGSPVASTFYPQENHNQDVVSFGGASGAGGGDMSQYDPWSKYRSNYGQVLDQQAGNDPSNMFRDKLAGMANGQFSPTDPSYQWRFDQGQQAVERSLAARGLLNSGNAAIELQQYGQGAASQEYGAQFSRMMQGMTSVESQYDTQMQRLMKMAGVIDPTEAGQLDIQKQNIKLGYANNDVARMGENRLLQGMQWDQSFKTNQDAGIGAGLGKFQGNTNTGGGLDLSQFASLFAGMGGYSTPAPSPTPSYTPSNYSYYTPGDTGPNYNGSDNFSPVQYTGAGSNSFDTASYDASYWTNPSLLGA